MHYILKEQYRSSTPGRSKACSMVVLHSTIKLILLKTERKLFITYLHKLVRERHKHTKNPLMASIMFTRTVSCAAFFYVLKINSIISVHNNSTKLSPQVIFPQKSYSVLDKTIQMCEMQSVSSIVS